MDTFLELFSMEGRANRRWYFWHIVLDDVFMLSLFVALVVFGAILDAPALMALPVMGVIAGGMWAGIAITVKRLHDLDRPGWHWLLLGIPFYNLYLGLSLLFARGTPGPNRFGPIPLQLRPSNDE